MAAPTITLITPAYGRPGGKTLIRIEGTNFDVAPTAGAGYIGEDTPETVQVLINNESAEDVRVYSSGLIYCLTPKYRGDPALLSASPGRLVDVVIRNVGPPVESTSYTGAFAYRRPDLARRSGLANLILDALTQEMRRQILDNVALSTSLDYDETTGDSLNLVELAEAPGIALFGPDASEDRFRRRSYRPSETNEAGDEFTARLAPRYEIWTFTATLIGRTRTEVMNLVQEFATFFATNKDLEVQKDSGDISQGYVKLPLWLTRDPARSGQANDSGLLSFDATFEVHGIEIDEDEGRSIEWGKTLGDPADVELDMEAG